MVFNPLFLIAVLGPPSWKVLSRGFELRDRRSDPSAKTIPKELEHQMLFIKRVIVKNVRCFEFIDLEFDLGGHSPPWTILVGDNATGKTTLLRSIAIGLCDESSAAGLLKESDTGYIRRGAKEAEIVIEFASASRRSRRPPKIRTVISQVSGRLALERLSQETHPPVRFPWNEVFACAYGAGRGTSGTGDIAGYSVVNAVYNLFNYSEGLQNPELTIRRLMPRKRTSRQRQVLKVLADLMSLDGVNLDQGFGTSTGIRIDASWAADMPLRDLADGYKSTFLWVSDFLGWALEAQPDVDRLSDITGVVLVDELEQHLHPQWQRDVVRSLRKAFPNIQFIASTHSPLVARSVGKPQECDGDHLYHLAFAEGRSPAVQVNAVDTVHGQKIDQILASPLFEWLIDEDPETEAVFRRASELLLAGDSRSSEEESEYQDLREHLTRLLLPEGQTPIERSIVDQREREIVDETLNLRRRLGELE